ncbi:unnamed protein product, partial [Prorocentrum cordatum]
AEAAAPAAREAAEPGATCRICLQGDVPQDELLAPCACQGSAKWVHAGCLREWQRTVLRGPISAFDRVTTCDICRQRFRCGVPPALQLRLAGSFLGRALVNLPLLLAIPFCWTVATGSYAWLSGQLQPGVVGLGVGSLLVATDRIRTGIFARSVVLLVEHSAWGAKDWAHHHQPPHERQRPHCPLPRGPRAQEHLRRSPLHGDVWADDAGAVQVLDGVWWRETGSGSAHAPGEFPRESGGPLLRLRGFAGWAPRQLEGEVRRGAWRVVNGSQELVFGDPASLWQRLAGAAGDRDAAALGTGVDDAEDAWPSACAVASERCAENVEEAEDELDRMEDPQSWAYAERHLDQQEES